MTIGRIPRGALWGGVDGQEKEWDRLHPEARERHEAAARAVALHVLEVAAPTSPILAAMKAGASFEDAAARAPTLAPSDEPCRPGCSVACAVTPEHDARRLEAGRAFLAEFRREERERMVASAARIDEPSPAELEGSIGEISPIP